jgi:hypothetical protein
MPYLAESKRGDASSLQRNVLDGLGREEEVGVLPEEDIDVVERLVGGDERRLKRLEESVRLPRESSALGVAGERLLSDDGDGVALGSAEVGEDVLVDTGLVLVVRLGRGSVDRDDVDVVGGKVPDGERSSERGDGRVRSFEHTVLAKRGLLLSTSLGLDERHPLLDVGGGGTSGELVLEELVLVRKPLLDLLSSEGKLTSSVLDVEEGSGSAVGGGKLSRDRQHSSSGSWDGSARLVAETRKKRSA